MILGQIPSAEVIESKLAIERLRDTNSSKEKLNILEEYKDNDTLKTILELTYNKHKKYGLSKKVLDKIEPSEESKYESLESLAEVLCNSNINDELRQDTKKFLVDTDYKIRDIYEGILFKDLKCGITEKSINKVWKGLISTGEDAQEISPMLASKFDFKPMKGDFVITEKLDGIRCWAIVDANEVKLYSRQGKRIEGCIEIEEDIRAIYNKVGIEKFILDGELLAQNCHYANVYKETVKRVRNKKEIKTGLEYMVFDIIDYREFESKQSTTIYEHRRTLLNSLKHDLIMERIVLTSRRFTICILDELYRGNDINIVIGLLDKIRASGAEGLMLNKLDAPYEFKRSKAILKIKVMQTADLRIIGFEEGTGKNKDRLGALLVDFKGNTVGVGSGFSDFDRDYIWNNKDLFLNKIAEIQYFEITQNKDGEESLRFPVWKHLRTDKTEPSYN